LVHSAIHDSLNSLLRDSISRYFSYGSQQYFQGSSVQEYQCLLDLFQMICDFYFIALLYNSGNNFG